MFQADLLILSCDLVTDIPLEPLENMFHKHNAAVTVMLAPSPTVPDTAVPGGKGSKKFGMTFQ